MKEKAQQVMRIGSSCEKLIALSPTPSHDKVSPFPGCWVREAEERVFLIWCNHPFAFS
jgi:hypothetical protein